MEPTDLLPEETVLKSYARGETRFVLTDRRLLAESSSWAGPGLGRRSTWIFLEDLDAVEMGTRGHPWLALLGALALFLGMLAQSPLQPLLLIAFALIAAYFLTRRKGVTFHAGGAKMFIEAWPLAETGELSELIQAVLEAKDTRWSG